MSTATLQGGQGQCMRVTRGLGEAPCVARVMAGLTLGDRTKVMLIGTWPKNLHTVLEPEAVPGLSSGAGIVVRDKGGRGNTHAKCSGGARGSSLRPLAST